MTFASRLTVRRKRQGSSPKSRVPAVGQPSILHSSQRSRERDLEMESASESSQSSATWRSRFSLLLSDDGKPTPSMSLDPTSTASSTTKSSSMTSKSSTSVPAKSPKWLTRTLFSRRTRKDSSKRGSRSSKRSSISSSIVGGGTTSAAIDSSLATGSTRISTGSGSGSSEKTSSLLSSLGTGRMFFRGHIEESLSSSATAPTIPSASATATTATTTNTTYSMFTSVRTATPSASSTGTMTTSPGTATLSGTPTNTTPASTAGRTPGMIPAVLSDRSVVGDIHLPEVDEPHSSSASHTRRDHFVGVGSEMQSPSAISVSDSSPMRKPRRGRPSTRHSSHRSRVSSATTGVIYSTAISNTSSGTGGTHTTTATGSSRSLSSSQRSRKMRIGTSVLVGSGSGSVGGSSSGRSSRKKRMKKSPSLSQKKSRSHSRKLHKGYTGMRKVMEYKPESVADGDPPLTLGLVEVGGPSSSSSSSDDGGESQRRAMIRNRDRQMMLVSDSSGSETCRMMEASGHRTDTRDLSSEIIMFSQSRRFSSVSRTSRDFSQTMPDTAYSKGSEFESPGTGTSTATPPNTNPSASSALISGSDSGSSFVSPVFGSASAVKHARTPSIVITPVIEAPFEMYHKRKGRTSGRASRVSLTDIEDVNPHRRRSRRSTVTESYEKDDEGEENDDDDDQGASRSFQSKPVLGSVNSSVPARRVRQLEERSHWSHKRIRSESYQRYSHARGSTKDAGLMVAAQRAGLSPSPPSMMARSFESFIQRRIREKQKRQSSMSPPPPPLMGERMSEESRDETGRSRRRGDSISLSSSSAVKGRGSGRTLAKMSTGHPRLSATASETLGGQPWVSRFAWTRKLAASAAAAGASQKPVFHASESSRISRSSRYQRKRLTLKPDSSSITSISHSPSKTAHRSGDGRTPSVSRTMSMASSSVDWSVSRKNDSLVTPPPNDWNQGELRSSLLKGVTMAASPTGKETLSHSRRQSRRELLDQSTSHILRATHSQRHSVLELPDASAELDGASQDDQYYVSEKMMSDRKLPLIRGPPMLTTVGVDPLMPELDLPKMPTMMTKVKKKSGSERNVMKLAGRGRIDTPYQRSPRFPSEGSFTPPSMSFSVWNMDTDDEGDLDTDMEILPSDTGEKSFSRSMSKSKSISKSPSKSYSSLLGRRKDGVKKHKVDSDDHPSSSLKMRMKKMDKESGSRLSQSITDDRQSDGLVLLDGYSSSTSIYKHSGMNGGGGMSPLHSDSSFDSSHPITSPFSKVYHSGSRSKKRRKKPPVKSASLFESSSMFQMQSSSLDLSRLVAGPTAIPETRSSELTLALARVSGAMSKSRSRSDSNRSDSVITMSATGARTSESGATLFHTPVPLRDSHSESATHSVSLTSEMSSVFIRTPRQTQSTSRFLLDHLSDSRKGFATSKSGLTSSSAVALPSAHARKLAARAGHGRFASDVPTLRRGSDGSNDDSDLEFDYSSSITASASKRLMSPGIVEFGLTPKHGITELRGMSEAKITGGGTSILSSSKEPRVRTSHFDWPTSYSRSISSAHGLKVRGMRSRMKGRKSGSMSGSFSTSTVTTSAAASVPVLKGGRGDRINVPTSESGFKILESPRSSASHSSTVPSSAALVARAAGGRGRGSTADSAHTSAEYDEDKGPDSTSSGPSGGGSRGRLSVLEGRRPFTGSLDSTSGGLELVSTLESGTFSSSSQGLQRYYDVPPHIADAIARRKRESEMIDKPMADSHHHMLPLMIPEGSDEPMRTPIPSNQNPDIVRKRAEANAAGPASSAAVIESAAALVAAVSSGLINQPSDSGFSCDSGFVIDPSYFKPRSRASSSATPPPSSAAALTDLDSSPLSRGLVPLSSYSAQTSTVAGSSKPGPPAGLVDLKVRIDDRRAALERQSTQLGVITPFGDYNTVTLAHPGHSSTETETSPVFKSEKGRSSMSPGFSTVPPPSQMMSSVDFAECKSTSVDMTATTVHRTPPMTSARPAGVLTRDSNQTTSTRSVFINYDSRSRTAPIDAESKQDGRSGMESSSLTSAARMRSSVVSSAVGASSSSSSAMSTTGRVMMMSTDSIPASEGESDAHLSHTAAHSTGASSSDLVSPEMSPADRPILTSVISDMLLDESTAVGMQSVETDTSDVLSSVLSSETPPPPATATRSLESVGVQHDMVDSMSLSQVSQLNTDGTILMVGTHDEKESGYLSRFSDAEYEEEEDSSRSTKSLSTSADSFRWH